MTETHPEVDTIIDKLNGDCVRSRQDAAKQVQYLVLTPLPPNSAERLLAEMAGKLKLRDDGTPTESCHYVRERIANAIELACGAGHNVLPHVHLVNRAANHDPHSWVRDAAKEALNVISKHLDISLGSLTSSTAHVVPRSREPHVQKAKSGQ